MSSLQRRTSNFKAASRRRPATTANHCSSGELMTVQVPSSPMRVGDGRCERFRNGEVPPLWRDCRLRPQHDENQVRFRREPLPVRVTDSPVMAAAGGCYSSHGAQGARASRIG